MEKLAEMQIMIRGWIELYGLAAIKEQTKLSAHHIRKTYNTLTPDMAHVTVVVTCCRAMDAERAAKVTEQIQKLA